MTMTGTSPSRTPTGTIDGLRVLVDDDDLRVTQRLGAPERHVVSFTGVGLGLGGLSVVQREEFGRSLNGPGNGAGDFTTTFVIDKRRSWLNGIRDQTLNILREVLRDARETVTLGNSMGGFAALYFAGLLPACHRAVAFSPQFSVHPAHMPVGETRWAEYRAAITWHVVTHAFEHASDAVDYALFFGTTAPPDLAHIACFERAMPLGAHLHRIAEGGHDVSQVLRVSGALGPVLEAMLLPRHVAAEEVDAILRRHGLTPGSGLPPGHEAMPPNDRLARWTEARAALRAQRRVGTPVNAPGNSAGPAGNQAPAGVEATDPVARGRAERMAARRALRRQGKP